ncbi:MAG: hypothetical protein JWO64_2695 [Hyphomicrobiales bacterium]|jgi:hypothetical protein|nr:hypothetical protein [Hyphomicrobiales bacterium]
MVAQMHPEAVGHPPAYFVEPGSSDTVMWIIAAILVVSVLGTGLLFLRLHTLPERIAHKRQKLQFEIVAVLGLLALFTHVHWFWVAGLILALIDLPDFSGLVRRIAGSLDDIASNTAVIGGSRPELHPPVLKREQDPGSVERTLTDA